jgi:hypothetical protein
VSAVREVAGKLDEGVRRALVYEGSLLVFKDVGPLGELRGFADALIRDELGTTDPVRAQFEMDRDDYLARVGSLQKRFRGSEDARGLFLAVLDRVGVDLHQTLWDWLYLRVLPSGDEYASGRAAKLGVHRDTWSSNAYAQTNWWTPIYPITPGRGLAFYPDYWARPLENSSAGWDLEEVRDRRRAGEPVDLVPRPVEPVDTSSEVRLAPEPGDLLCFSGAHLHASVPNTTGVARFSIEVRTVNAEDVAAGRGAPNVDGHAPRIASSWFSPVHEGA